MSIFEGDLPVPAAIEVEACKTHFGGGYYYTYADTYRKDGKPVLLFRTFAMRTRSDKQLCREVIREEVTTTDALVRNMQLNACGGYVVRYEKKPRRKVNAYYGYELPPFDEWETWTKVPGVCRELINPQAVLDFPGYEHVGLERYQIERRMSVSELLQYLRAYQEDSGIEFFGKLGIQPTPKLVQKAKKDRQFLRFLRDHADEASCHGTEVILTAYREKTSFRETAKNLKARRDMQQYLSSYYNCKGITNKVHAKTGKIVEYLEKHDVKPMTYGDYINACVYLGLDMKDTKNSFPSDFQRMHDLRINEYASRRADEQRRQAAERRAHQWQMLCELDEKFQAAAKELQRMTWYGGGDYCIIIPDHVGDLVAEGEYLQHCVGKMGYDNKMAKHVSFIAFVRKVDDIDVPYVTVEVSCKNGAVLQCYAAHDSKPADDILATVTRWANEKVHSELEKMKKEGWKAA